VLVTFEKAHATRSLEQNALYWAGYVVPIAEHLHCSEQWTHAYLKQRFLRGRRMLIQNDHGEVVDDREVAALTTTHLDKIEFGEYLNAIKEWCIHELGIDVGTNRPDVSSDVAHERP